MTHDFSFHHLMLLFTRNCLKRNTKREAFEFEKKARNNHLHSARRRVSFPCSRKPPWRRLPEMHNPGVSMSRKTIQRKMLACFDMHFSSCNVPTDRAIRAAERVVSTLYCSVFPLYFTKRVKWGVNIESFEFEREE